MSKSSDKPRDHQPFMELDLAPSWAQGPHTPSHDDGGGQRRKATREAPRRRPAAPSRRPSNNDGHNAPSRPAPSKHGPPAMAPGSMREQRNSGRAPDRFRTPDATGLPLKVHFIPARHGMETLAKRLAESRRAFPLGKLTALFLSRLDSVVVRLSPDSQTGETAEPPLRLFQCRKCRTAYLDRDPLIQHILTDHLDLFYRCEETETEPPSGNFICIARCGMSGELIGPPNFHGYHERLTSLHRERFAHIPFEVYRGKLDMCRDSQVIECWKEAMRKRKCYYPLSSGARPATDTKEDGESESVEPENGLTDANEVRMHFVQFHYAGAVNECMSCILPGHTARQLEDTKLRGLIEAAWHRESRSIMRTAITVRGILRSLGFCAFKTADQQAFMTAVTPTPLEDVKTVDTIKHMLTYVEDHPGCSRAALWEYLGLAETETTGNDGARHFQWLVEKGHLLFFHDGSLTLPGQLHAIRAPTASRRTKRKRTVSRKTKPGN